MPSDSGKIVGRADGSKATLMTTRVPFSRNLFPIAFYQNRSGEDGEAGQSMDG